MTTVLSAVSSAVFLLLAVSAAPVATAQAPQVSNAIDMLARADDDRDGAVTEAELRHFRREAFLRLDVNQDMRLSRADISQWARVMGTGGARELWDQYQATLDADRSGAVSRAEFIDGPAPLFGVLDADRNGTVDAAEFAAARAALAGAGRP